MFDDIQRKGVTRNFNSKPNESAHRPLKKFYMHHTNFKNVDSQVYLPVALHKYYVLHIYSTDSPT